jgi:1-acyl-sn-glycerol-3-phosphate acyltransferase
MSSKKIHFYPIYVLVVFISTFLILFPFMFLFVHFKGARNINHRLYRIWGNLVFLFAGIKWIVERRFVPEKGKTYVYCANHTSYIDIPSLYCTIHQDLSFIGKSSLKKVPLFGYIYSRIHILVNRKDVHSRKEVIERSKMALERGISMIFFPEGTIPKNNNPTMIEFKDGAFKIAIDKQIPIVPIVMPYNHIILPDNDKMQAHRHPCKMIFLPAIETKGMSDKDVGSLKEHVFKLISHELELHKVKLR